MAIEPPQQQLLYAHLNDLFLTDLNNYERTVGEITFACDLARDYYGTMLLTGWQGDYGDHTVSLGSRGDKVALTYNGGPHPERTVAPRVTTPPRSRPKGGRLPRSDYTRVGRGHDQELDMDMEYDSPPTSLMEAVSRAGSSISSSTSMALFRHSRVPDHGGRIHDSDSSCDSDSSNLLERGSGRSASSSGSDFHARTVKSCV